MKHFILLLILLCELLLTTKISAVGKYQPSKLSLRTNRSWHTTIHILSYQSTSYKDDNAICIDTEYAFANLNNNILQLSSL